MQNLKNKPKNFQRLTNCCAQSGKPGLRFLFYLTLILLLVQVPVQAQSISRVGTTAAPFLKIGVGGRALGMGEAYTTQAEDVTGLFWNPGGLARIEKIQILLNHYDYLAGLYYEFGAIAIPFPQIGTFGFFLSYLGMPEIERTTIQFPDGNGEKVSANSFAAGISFARALTDRFSIGGSAKYIRETIWHSQAAGIAFDIGLLYRTFFKNLKIGMSISNFGSDLQMSGRDMLIQHDIAPNTMFAGNNENINAHLDTDQFPLPILFRVGLSANLAKDFFNLSQYDWIVAVDAFHPNDNREYLNVGTEVLLYDLLALRTGYRQVFLDEREGGLCYGFGLHFHVRQSDLYLDYASVDFGRLDRQNKFSLIFSF